MKKLFAVLISLVAFAGTSLAVENAPAKDAVTEVPLTIIVVDDDDPTGGVDANLNNGLEYFLGAKLKVNEVKRSAALKDPAYQGFNLDYMPIYLFESNDFTKTKLAEFIKRGQAKERNGKIIFMTNTGLYANKEKRENEIDLYVMSQCPFGVRAENQIIDLMKLDRIPKNIKINVRYIVSEMPDGSVSSMHGSAEWEEDVRQVIIREKYPKKFWKYLEIRNKDYRSSLWDRAAEEAGINPRIFAKYWKFGLQKLKEDIQYTKDYEISASPSVIWQGRTSTSIGALGNIKGLEGFKQNYGGGNAGGAAPQGRC